MLPIEPEKLSDMKARFVEAVRVPVDIDAVKSGKHQAASRIRRHVFDFDDGMRMIISMDDYEGHVFLHVSASGTEQYAETIRGEGLDGFMEDVLLRLSALMGGYPSDTVEAMVTENGILHLVFQVEHDEIVKRCERVRDEDSREGN